jgi:predicted nuclease of restriction endonuclease-like (RecB) superfamily
MSTNLEINNIYTNISNLLKEARQQVIKSVNTTMVITYFEIGRIIVEEEQKGELKADYGKKLLENLSVKLTAEFGSGFSKRNLEQMRKFYLAYQKGQMPSDISVEGNSIAKTVSSQFKLGWSHYVLLSRIVNIDERNFYEIEATNANWSFKELQRQINSALYERLVLSRDKEEIKKLSEKGHIIEKPKDIIKDPYILEFLGLPEFPNYSETTLENAIITHLEKFIMELGKGFLFQGRQVRFTFDEEHFFVDLVFYNRILKCFVLFDLKIGKLKHQDIGQMQMYVNYYDRFVKLDDENKTIGIIICKDKNNTLIEITMPENNTQIFASQYLTILPSKEELKKIVDQDDNNE